MIYQGSKRRIAKKLVDIMIQPDTQCFVDLFCGGGNLLERVDCPHIIANDLNKYVIECLKALWGGNFWTSYQNPVKSSPLMTTNM